MSSRKEIVFDFGIYFGCANKSDNQIVVLFL